MLSIDFHKTSENIDDNLITTKEKPNEIEKYCRYSKYFDEYRLRKKIRDECPITGNTYRISINGKLLTHISTHDGNHYFLLIKDGEFVLD